MKPRRYGIDELYLCRESGLTEELRKIFGVSAADTGFIRRRAPNCETMNRLQADCIKAIARHLNVNKSHLDGQNGELFPH
jgi:hypothetical protein